MNAQLWMENAPLGLEKFKQRGAVTVTGCIISWKGHWTIVGEKVGERTGVKRTDTVWMEAINKVEKELVSPNGKGGRASCSHRETIYCISTFSQ